MEGISCYEIMVLFQGRYALNKKPFNCSLAPHTATPPLRRTELSPGRSSVFPLSPSLPQGRAGKEQRALLPAKANLGLECG